MRRAAGATAPAVGATTPPSGNARLVSIDILRGLAILWVIVFHVWIDLTQQVYAAPDMYRAFGSDLIHGLPFDALRDFGQVFASQGYLGVPVFMMLSGLSLTLNAYRRGEPGVLRGYWTRFRRIVPVYWAGIGIVLVTVSVIALLQVHYDGGTFRFQWSQVRYDGPLWKPIQITRADVAWALVPGLDIVNGGLARPPVGSLWFVPLLLQYYLIFPFALMLLRRIGVVPFTAITVALTVGAHAAWVPLSHQVLDQYDSSSYGILLAPFRASEFFLGMTLGYLLACRRDAVAAWTRSAFDVAGIVVIGVGLVMASILALTPDVSGLVESDLLLNPGLALLMVPLLFKTPGRLEASIPARVAVLIGVVSFTALIMNDQMRYVASFLRHEGAHGAGWWFFLVVIYVPLGTLLAYPLAWVFGLLPRQRASQASRPESPPVPQVAPDPQHEVRAASAQPARRAAAERAGS